jgi:hypothetical protein
MLRGSHWELAVGRDLSEIGKVRTSTNIDDINQDLR